MAGMQEIEDQLNAGSASSGAASGMIAWPPPGDLPRLRAYDRNRLLHDGDHKTVYVTGGKYRYDTDREYVAVNICGEITDLIVDRLFGETVQLRATSPAALGDGEPNEGASGEGGFADGSTGETPVPRIEDGQGSGGDGAQAWIDHLAEVSQLDTMLVELGRGVSYRGDGAIKVRYDADREDVLLSSVSSALLFTETAPGDVTTITAITIAYTVPHPQQPKTTLLFQERHTRGRIVYSLHIVQKSRSGGGYRYRPDADRVPLETLPELADLAARLDEDGGQDTGVDELLIIPIAMGGSDESGVWGRSDYADIDDMQGELNNRVTQIAGIQDKHSDPWMYGPPMFLTEDQKLDPRYKYFSVDRQEQAPGYITWEAQLQHAETAIARLKADMLFTAGLSPESFGLGEGAAESGRALKLRQHRTASAVRMRQRVYDRALRQAASVASKLANSDAIDGQVWDGRPIPELEPGEIAIGWNDGLPNDETEAIERAGTALTMGVMSLARAVRTAQPDLSDAEVAAEIEAIRAQKESARPRLAFGAPAIAAIAPAATDTDSQQGAQAGAQVTQVTRRGPSI